jgi:electron transfer flavoprotein alpha subunit
MSGWEGIWVFIEQEAGVVDEASLGILSRARELGDSIGMEVTALLLGRDVSREAKKLGRYGAHKVIVVEDDLLEYYLSEPYSMIVGDLIEERRPDTLLFSATRNGRDLAGRLAVRFRTGLIAHVISLEYDKEKALVGRVPGFGGNIVAVVKCAKGRPQMATVTPGIFPPKSFEGEAELENISLDIDLTKLKMRIVERNVGEAVDLSRSEKVVIAGMGTGGNLDLVSKLAELLDADIGVTRPLADIGVASRDIQIGSTGVILNSKLAIVLGASGAPHFVAGIKDCGTVISINKDPDAPIIDYSDYLFVGDIFEILPRLIEKLKR